MLSFGRVTKTSIGKNKDGTKNVVLLQCAVTSPEDIQTVELITQAGDDSRPSVGNAVLIIPVSESYKVGIAVDDHIAPSVGEGEKEIYSSENGTKKATIKVLKNEEVQLNGTGDFAVKYTQLAIAFNLLKAEFTAHIHSGVTTGLGSSGPITVPITADISIAKVDKVRLPV